MFSSSFSSFQVQLRRAASRSFSSLKFGNSNTGPSNALTPVTTRSSHQGSFPRKFALGLSVVGSAMCFSSSSEAQSSQPIDKFADTRFYPASKAYAEGKILILHRINGCSNVLYFLGHLKVSDIHSIYYAEYGNPKGKPVLFVHGGPGGGTEPAMARYFDPKVYRVILVDQRGCGKSTPFAELRENTTPDLVNDFEKLRVKLGIEKWQVFGGSWGKLESGRSIHTRR